MDNFRNSVVPSSVDQEDIEPFRMGIERHIGWLEPQIEINRTSQGSSSFLGHFLDPQNEVAEYLLGLERLFELLTCRLELQFPFEPAPRPSPQTGLFGLRPETCVPGTADISDREVLRRGSDSRGEFAVGLESRW
jgi:hypothetical protein